MMISPAQGRFFSLLVRLLQPRRILELGTFTGTCRQPWTAGYATLCLAEAAPPGAQIVTCDLNASALDIAQRHVRRAGLAAAVRLENRNALALIESTEGPFDLIFVDARKSEYAQYWEGVQRRGLLAPRGLAIFDNVLHRNALFRDDASEREKRVARHMDAFLSSLAGQGGHTLLRAFDGLSLLWRT